MQVFSRFVARFFVALYPNCTNTAATITFAPDKNILFLVVQLRLADEGDEMKHGGTNLV